MLHTSRDDFVPTAVRLLHNPISTVLDIGPGIKPQWLVQAKTHVCVEPYREYAERLAREHPGFIILNCTWAEAVDLLPPDSVDTIVLMDVIEHLEKEEGTALLAATVALARGQVVVHTPLGFMPQGENEKKDAWGLDGTEWQIHRSGWLPEDFPGWEVVVCEQFHTHDAYGRRFDEPYGALFAVLNKGEGLDPGVFVRFMHRRLTSKNVVLRTVFEWGTGLARRVLRQTAKV